MTAVAEILSEQTYFYSYKRNGKMSSCCLHMYRETTDSARNIQFSFYIYKQDIL